jgi:hypothetical protein
LKQRNDELEQTIEILRAATPFFVRESGFFGAVGRSGVMAVQSIDWRPPSTGTTAPVT